MVMVGDCLCWMYIFLVHGCLATTDLSMRGRHIRVIPIPAPFVLNIERNTSGHIVLMTGPLSSLIDPLSEKFTLEIDQTDTPSLFDTPNHKGGLFYLINKKVDLLLGVIVLVSERLTIMDFPYTFMKEHLVLLMPMPFKTVYGIFALWKPLQPPIWCGLITTLVVMLAVLVYVLKDKSTLEVLLSQGGVVRYQTLPHYLVAGSWSLGSFVLVTAYSSVLISFITAPVYQPLVNSVDDLVQKTNVYPVVEKGKAPDLLLQQGAKNRVGRVLLSRLNRDPTLRCLTPEACLQKVREGNNVYIQVASVALDQIGREYQRTGICDLNVLKERFMQFYASIALQKNSLFTDAISKELMRMEAAGLTDVWWNKVVTDPTRCLDEARARPQNPRLNLKGLIGAFFVLGFGGVLSVVAFCTEIIIFYQCRIFKQGQKLLICA